MPLRIHSDALERIYADYNRCRYVHPDPLEFLFDYEDPDDREIVALIAASLAYGRVAQILRSVSAVLKRLGPGPRRFVYDAAATALRRTFNGFKHRFATGSHLAALLCGVKRLLRQHGTLEGCFTASLRSEHRTVLPALTAFARQLSNASGGGAGHLLPDPAKGSACKRLNLMLRWMVRRDEVDPGGWRAVRPSMLIVPLDTHMHRITLALGATRRKAASMQTALEVTGAFRALCPQDPVKYDFALSRLGIHPDLDLDQFLQRLGCLE